jgi:hypothetical protein
MAHRTQYLSYQVYLTDPAQVQALQTEFPRGRIMAPDDAATEYSAPIQLDDVAFSAPCTRSPWFQSTFNYPRNVYRFLKPTNGWWSLFVTGDGRFIWVAQFVYANASPNTQGQTVLTDRIPVPQRHFACGFELLAGSVSEESGEGPTLSGPPSVTRSASRIPGGYGLALRGDNGRATMFTTRNTGGGASTKRSTWTRLYATRRSNAQGYLWSAMNVNARGIFLQLLDGVGVVRDGSSGGNSVIGTIPDLLPTLHETVRIDILLTWGIFTAGFPLTGADVGQVDILKNGEHKLSLTVTANNNGITVENAANSLHHQSDLGFGGTNDAGFAVDVDDWDQSDFPGTNGRTWGNFATVINNHYYYQGNWWKALTVQTGSAPSASDTVNWLRLAPPIDFQNGTHIARVSAKSLSASDTGWVGDFRLLMQQPPTAPAAHLLGRTSTTSGAVCQVATDFIERVLRRPGFMHVAAFTVATYANRGLAADGDVGYKLGPAAPVTATIVQTTSPAYGRLMYRPGAIATPAAITDLEILHTKGAEANGSSCYGLQAAVEMIGQFQDCDIPFGSGVTIARPNRGGPHNSDYPLSQWVQAVAPPISPVRIQSGTYVGNGTGQDLTFSVPPTFLYIRGTGGADAGGVWKWPSMLAAHHSTNDGPSPVLLPDVRENMDFAGAGAEGQAEQQYFVRLGASNQVNALGVTYQYLAICDPGMRFLCATAGAFDSSFTTGFSIPLPLPDFLPEAVLSFTEIPGNATSAQAKHFRGPGHTGNQASPSAAAVYTNALSIQTGAVTAFPSLQIGDGRTHAFLCMRSDDGSGDAGARRVVEFQTWTGNGSGARDILIPGSTGRRPLFIAVWPNDAGGMHFRDPSHTGANSSRYDGAGIGNAITAGGLDQFTVGAALNVNAVVYNALIVLGGTTAGNGGLSADVTEDPVAADSIASDEYDELTDEDIEDQGYDPDTFDELPGAALTDDSDVDTETAISTSSINLGGLTGGQVCEVYTRKIVNRALQRIGHSKRIANLATETTEAAYQSRDHIGDDINQVLRDFDWPFATRYEDLVLVGGTDTDPVNDDWQYSYRLPNGCIKARRIVPQDGDRRRQDDDPIEFRPGTDTTGGLIFCNEKATADIPLVLEFTSRLPCPAFFGDALFRDAVAWKHAASLAGALARDSKKQEFCLAMYARALEWAEAPAANEQQVGPDQDAPWIQERN